MNNNSHYIDHISKTVSNSKFHVNLVPLILLKSAKENSILFYINFNVKYIIFVVLFLKQNKLLEPVREKTSLSYTHSDFFYMYQHSSMPSCSPMPETGWHKTRKCNLPFCKVCRLVLSIGQQALMRTKRSNRRYHFFGICRKHKRKAKFVLNDITVILR